MDLFEKTSRISVPTMIFGTLALVFGWLVTGTQNPIAQLQLGEIALTFLSLFFYALARDEAEQARPSEKKKRVVS